MSIRGNLGNSLSWKTVIQKLKVTISYIWSAFVTHTESSFVLADAIDGEIIFNVLGNTDANGNSVSNPITIESINNTATQNSKAVLTFSANAESIDNTRDEIKNNKLIKKISEPLEFKNAIGWSLGYEKTNTIVIVNKIGIVNNKFLGNETKNVIRCIIGETTFVSQSANYVYSVDTECIAIANTNYVWLRINKSRLSAVDSASVEAWLRSQITAILKYELAIPQELPSVTTYTINGNQTDKLHSFQSGTINITVPDGSSIPLIVESHTVGIQN